MAGGGGGARASAFRALILLDTNVVSAVDLRDTLIAGIALANQAQLATRNLRHFNDTSLRLINPFPATSSE